MRNISAVLFLFLLAACNTPLARTEQVATPTHPSQPGADDLPGTRWMLLSFVDSGVQASLVNGSTVTLEFNEDGQAGGSGGCNSYGSRYEIQEGNLSIFEIVSTLMACADEQVMQQEQRYFEALGSVTGYMIKGESLSLSKADGKVNLIFIKATSD